MGSECYAMTRGRVIRVTRLSDRGRFGSPTQFTTSKTVATVRVNEVTEAGSSGVLTSEHEERRLRLIRPDQMIRHSVDIDFLRTEPTTFNMIAGVPIVRTGDGFGEIAFGEDPMGDGVGNGGGGFDLDTRTKPTAFALEVWTKLAGQVCEDGSPKWGYTLFPYLRGGRITGFTFHNGLVNFSLVGAQSRRGSRWSVGPYDLEGDFKRLVNPVSRNTSFRTTVVTGQPPTQQDGLQEIWDAADNGTAANPHPFPDDPLILDGEQANTSVWIIDGGRA